ncbi:MAG TPA: phospholipase D-like domain-containing protein [Candidatus Sulfomarinibacteraceae bacterium]|nr:phospholipase D-like domain-containing protein [Candidatus Sulfomarinibacteraceae bacterium]
MNRSTSPLALAGLILLLALSAIACDITINIEGLGQPRTVTTSHEGDWYEIYFTNPTCPDDHERVGGVDQIIADDLLLAERSVDIAAFDLDAEPIVAALIALAQRGVTVRVVTDDQNDDLTSIRRLRRHGTSVVTDGRSALMHNKFIVIDDRYVWTGSMNYTSNGAYCNNNNAVRFDSPELATNFRTEMDEMYDDRRFGPTSPDHIPYPRLQINEALIETYFTAEADASAAITRRVAEAQEEILFMAFSFTDDAIGEAMLERAAAGVEVQGVFERVGSETSFSLYPAMRDSGLRNVRVRQDGNPRIMHHKVIVIDREVVVFGSYNFSASANERNDENVVIVHDPVFASYFVDEFGFVWAEAQQ